MSNIIRAPLRQRIMDRLTSTGLLKRLSEPIDHTQRKDYYSAKYFIDTIQHLYGPSLGDDATRALFPNRNPSVIEMYDIIQEYDELLNPRPINHWRKRGGWLLSWKIQNRNLQGFHISPQLGEDTAEIFVHWEELHLADMWTIDGKIKETQHSPRRYNRDNFPPNVYGQYPQQKLLGQTSKTP